MGKEQPGKKSSMAEIDGYGYCSKCRIYHKKTSDMYLKHNQWIKNYNSSLEEFF